MFSLFKKKNLNNDIVNEAHDSRNDPCIDTSISWDNLTFGGEKSIAPDVKEDNARIREPQFFSLNDDQQKSDANTKIGVEQSEQQVPIESDADTVLNGKLSKSEIDEIIEDAIGPKNRAISVSGFDEEDYRRSFSDSELDGIVEKNRTAPKYIDPHNVIMASSLIPTVNERDNYIMPRIKRPASDRNGQSINKIKDWALDLIDVLHENSVNAVVESVDDNSLVITYGLRLEKGVRVSSVTRLKDEIALRLGTTVEFEIPLKGTTLLGVHLEKVGVEPISISQVLYSAEYTGSKARIPLLLGTSAYGEVIVDDLDRIGHLLIGGTTGTGKSVLLDSLIMGMLYKTSPWEVQFIMIDTGSLNLPIYNGIPSLIYPVITEPNRVPAILTWANSEVRVRSRALVEAGLKDIDDFNVKNPDNKVPHVVIVIDEVLPIIEYDENIMAEIQILSQLGKPVGIHLIMSTQIAGAKSLKQLRDSINARALFNVFSEAESKAFIGMSGAEKLQGIGNMLYKCPGNSNPIKITGINVLNDDVADMVDEIKKRNTSFSNAIGLREIDLSSRMNDGIWESRDEYFVQAGNIIIERNKASIGMIQRVFKIGFNRSNRIMEQLYNYGVVGDEEGTKPRKVLMDADSFRRLVDKIGT